MPWLFVDPISRGNQPGKWNYGPLLRHLYAHLEGLGGPQRGLHTFRHTGTTYYANLSNMRLAQLQKFSGHRDIKTTMRCVHPDVDDIAESLKQLDYDGLAGSR